MQSKNQVVILGISFLKNGTGPLSLTVRLTDLEKESPSYFAVASWTSNFILYFYNALDMFSPNEVDLVEVSCCFFKSEKASGQTVWPININSSAFLSYHSRLVFKLFL